MTPYCLQRSAFSPAKSFSYRKPALSMYWQAILQFGQVGVAKRMARFSPEAAGAAAGAALAVVSNKPDRTVKELAAIHFPGLLQIAVGENEAGGVRRKPWPDTLLTAAEALGVRPGDCLYVGDSEVDVLTASRAGMDCASVLWGFRSREELIAAGAKLLFDTPGELGAFILNS